MIVDGPLRICIFGQKLTCWVMLKKNLMRNLEASFPFQTAGNLARMFVFGHMGNFVCTPDVPFPNQVSVVVYVIVFKIVIYQANTT